ncbi:MAG: antibiotic biosynthesis monooxygenase [Acidobacteriota bacterium]
MKVKTSAGNWKDVVDILSSLTGPIQIEHGCLGCGLHYDVQDSESILFVEEWENTADLARHFQSPHYRRILAAMELSETAPEVQFMTVARQEGMEIVGKARGERSNQR